MLLPQAGLGTNKLANEGKRLYVLTWYNCDLLLQLGNNLLVNRESGTCSE